MKKSNMMSLDQMVPGTLFSFSEVRGCTTVIEPCLCIWARQYVSAYGERCVHFGYIKADSVIMNSCLLEHIQVRRLK